MVVEREERREKEAEEGKGGRWAMGMVWWWEIVVGYLFWTGGGVCSIVILLHLLFPCVRVLRRIARPLLASRFSTTCNITYIYIYIYFVRVINK